MPRPLRIEYAGAIHHILSRGNPRSLATFPGARSSRPPPSASRRRNPSPETQPPFRRILKHIANDSEGNRREAIFLDDGDRHDFLKTPGLLFDKEPLLPN
jgi:hypothetical protein